MNTCKTCKWHDNGGTRKLGPRQINEAKNGGLCHCPSIQEECTDLDHTPDALVYSYYESGTFWTGDNFGCVHHTPRT